MSGAAISWAFGQQVPTTARFVLVAMCDYVDQRNMCWASVASIMAKTGLKDRAVRNALVTLENAGVIVPVAKNSGGRSCTNHYRIMIENPARDAGYVPPDDENPAPDAGYEDQNPAPDAAFSGKNPASRARNPASGAKNPARRADNPRKNQELKEEIPPTPKGAEVVLPPWLPLSEWADWCDYRRGPAWTQRAAELTLLKLEKLRAKGHDPAEVINQSIASGWRGLFPLRESGRSADRGAWARDDFMRTLQ